MIDRGKDISNPDVVTWTRDERSLDHESFSAKQGPRGPVRCDYFVVNYVILTVTIIRFSFWCHMTWIDFLLVHVEFRHHRNIGNDVFRRSRTTRDRWTDGLTDTTSYIEMLSRIWKSFLCLAVCESVYAKLFYESAHVCVCELTSPAAPPSSTSPCFPTHVLSGGEEGGVNSGHLLPGTVKIVGHEIDKVQRFGHGGDVVSHHDVAFSSRYSSRQEQPRFA